MINSTPENIRLSEIKLSCSNCNLAELCLPRGLNLKELDKMEKIIKRSKPIQKGDYIFRSGDPFRSLYAVRSGTVKIYTIADDGNKQVMGFYFPGEIIGFDGIEKDIHQCSAVALETCTYCGINFHNLEEISSSIPGLQHQIFRLMSKEVTTENKLLLTLCNKNAEEKIATFLISLSHRFEQRGYSANEFKLVMSRQDIGNYLGLTIETVSRVFSKFQREQIIDTNQKIVNLKNIDALHQICKKTTESGDNQSNVA